MTSIRTTLITTLIEPARGAYCYEEFLPFERPPAMKGDVAAQVAAYMTVSRAQSRYERAVASCKPKAT